MKQTTIFQGMSDATRLRILALIAREGELCVCELVHALQLSQPKISRHLAALREADILMSRRDAQWVFYHLDPGLAEWQLQILSAAVVGLEGEPVVRRDRDRLRKMPNRPDRDQAARPVTMAGA